MLSYRHAFHAGNHADILKHLTLFLVLTYFNQKDKPYWYIDTHAGAGLYDLQSRYAEKNAEHLSGITQLKQQQNLPEALKPFLRLIDSFRQESATLCYPGSPMIAARTLRENDKLRLFELHPSDSAHLIHLFQTQKKRSIIKTEDGFNGLISLLPPATRRAVILIDPPYEEKQDYQRVVRTLKDALKRFATGTYLIWYPCLSREESKQLPEKLKKLLPENYLRAELYIEPKKTEGFGMTGSGMLILNPPYILKEQLQQLLPYLAETLKQKEGATYLLEGQMK